MLTIFELQDGLVVPCEILAVIEQDHLAPVFGKVLEDDTRFGDFVAEHCIL